MIKINLDDLTQAHIDEAAPFLRFCSYASPCIIGALIPPEHRAAADEPLPDSFGSATVDAIMKAGRIELPKQQLDEAVKLQEAFDLGQTDVLAELLAKRGLRWTGGTDG